MKKKILLIILSIGLVIAAIFSNKIQATDATNVTSTNYTVIEKNNGTIKSGNLSVKHYYFTGVSGDHSTKELRWTNIKAGDTVELRMCCVNI